MEQILSTGLELCQRALDLISVSGKDDPQVEKPGESHVLVFKRDDKSICFLGIEVLQIQK